MPWYSGRSRTYGSSQEKEKIQRDQSGEVDGTRGDRHASAGATHSYAQGVEERLQAQAYFGKIAFGGISGWMGGELSTRAKAVHQIAFVSFLNGF
jgi:hypothetical protein